MKRFSWKGAGIGLVIGLFCMMLTYCIGGYAYGKDPCFGACSQENRACISKAKSKTYTQHKGLCRALSGCDIEYGKCCAECMKIPSDNKGGQVIQK